jgi:hypothetical protein
MPTEMAGLDCHLPLKTWNSEWRTQVVTERSLQEGEKCNIDADETEMRLFDNMKQRF